MIQIKQNNLLNIFIKMRQYNKSESDQRREVVQWLHETGQYHEQKENIQTLTDLAMAVRDPMEVTVEINECMRCKKIAGIEQREELARKLLIERACKRLGKFKKSRLR